MARGTTLSDVAPVPGLAPVPPDVAPVPPDAAPGPSPGGGGASHRV